MWATRDGREQFDAGALILFGEAGLGKLQFEFAEDFDGGENGPGLLAEAGGHFKEDALDFALLFFEEADEFVVLLDGFERLDKDGLARGTGSVNDTLDAALLLGFDGDDETVATDGDQFVLQSIAFGEAAKIATKRVLNATALPLDIATYAAEGGRGVVVEGSVGRELVGEIAQERSEILDCGREFFDCRPGPSKSLRWMGDSFTPFGGAVDDEDGVAKLGGFERGSLNASALHELRGIDESAEIKASAGAEEGTHFGSELLLTVDPFGIGGGGERIHCVLAEFALATAAHDFAEAFELKGAGAGVLERGGHESHTVPYYRSCQHPDQSAPFEAATTPFDSFLMRHG